MIGLTIFGYHTFRDLNMVLTEKVIGSPEVKRTTIDVEGADGELDMTEFFGEVKYKNVQHRFTFEVINARNDFADHFTRIKNALHGKRGRIVLDDDPAHFYMGRCFVSSYTSEKNIGKISVECDCEPYKYSLENTVIYQAVDGTADVILLNGRKRAVPEIWIETADKLRLTYNTYSIWDLGSGVYTLPELELAEGENVVTVTGTGQISFTWREGNL